MSVLWRHQPLRHLQNTNGTTTTASAAAAAAAQQQKHGCSSTLRAEQLELLCAVDVGFQLICAHALPVITSRWGCILVTPPRHHWPTPLPPPCLPALPMLIAVGLGNTLHIGRVLRSSLAAAVAVPLDWRHIAPYSSTPSWACGPPWQRLQDASAVRTTSLRTWYHTMVRTTRVVLAILEYHGTYTCSTRVLQIGSKYCVSQKKNKQQTEPLRTCELATTVAARSLQCEDPFACAPTRHPPVASEPPLRQRLFIEDPETVLTRELESVPLLPCRIYAMLWVCGRSGR